MIGRLEGRLFPLRPGEVIVDAGGTGYRVSVPLRAFERLAGAGRAVLWIHTAVREDRIALYGFLEPEELDLFERLIAIAGVGPRTALAALSAMSVEEFALAVEGGDTARLRKVPGIGSKTADRIVLELAGALGTGEGPVDDRHADAISALVNLGYSEREARRAVESAGAPEDAPLSEILRLALKALQR